MTGNPIDILRRKLLGGLLSAPAALPTAMQAIVKGVIARDTAVNVPWAREANSVFAEVASGSGGNYELRRRLVDSINHALLENRTILRRESDGLDPDIASMRSLSGCAKLRKQCARNVEFEIERALQLNHLDCLTRELYYQEDAERGTGGRFGQR